jgi:chemotaxis protein CheC
MMGHKLDLSEAQLDALKEVGNIGAAHASAALEQMTSQRITIKVPRAYPLPVEDLVSVLGNEEDIIVMLFFKIFGEVEGSIIVTFTEEQAAYLANLLLGKDANDMEMTEEKESALKEVGNILTSSYLTAFSTLVGFNLMPSIPYIAYDMVAAVVDPLVIDLSQSVEYALVTDTEFLFSKRAVAGKCLTFFGRDSFFSILKAIGMQDK